MNVRELCRVLSATLHLPGVERWAKRLADRELLPGMDHKVYALDVALLLGAIVAAPRPEEAPHAIATLADLPLAFVERRVGSSRSPTWEPGTREQAPGVLGKRTSIALDNVRTGDGQELVAELQQ